MNVRLFHPEDLDTIIGIHEKFHSKDFDVKDYLNEKVMEKIVITNDLDRIITTAAIKPIAEVVAVTDMSISVRERRKALIQLLQSMQFVARMYGYDGIHCFPLTGDSWIKNLKEYGFQETKGVCLSLGV